MFNSKLYWTLCYFRFYNYQCISFASLVSIPIEVTTSAIGSKICAITAPIKKCKTIIKKKEKKLNKMVSLAKSKLISIEVLISKALIESVISHDNFVLINNVLKEYNEMKDEIKTLKTESSFGLSLDSLRSLLS